MKDKIFRTLYDGHLQRSILIRNMTQLTVYVCQRYVHDTAPILLDLLPFEGFKPTGN